MVSVMISSNGSLFGSLDEHKALFSTVLVHNLSLSCLVLLGAHIILDFH